MLDIIFISLYLVEVYLNFH